MVGCAPQNCCLWTGGCLLAQFHVLQSVHRPVVLPQSLNTYLSTLRNLGLSCSPRWASLGLCTSFLDLRLLDSAVFPFIAFLLNSVLSPCRGPWSIWSLWAGANRCHVLYDGSAKRSHYTQRSGRELLSGTWLFLVRPYDPLAPFLQDGGCFWQACESCSQALPHLENGREGSSASVGCLIPTYSPCGCVGLVWAPRPGLNNM